MTLTCSKCSSPFQRLTKQKTKNPVCFECKQKRKRDYYWKKVGRKRLAK